MKHKHIESLLSEIQRLESKVANLKENQKVPFSFFKESFKRTQEISRLLHELEFLQIEDMKGQMEKLVQFLSDSESSKQEAKNTPLVVVADTDDNMVNSHKEQQQVDPLENEIVEAESRKAVEKVEVEEVKIIPSEDVQEETLPTPPIDAPIVPRQEATLETAQPVVNHQKPTIVEHLGATNRSLNDIQPINHTIQDTKSRISLNDRFLFQRELFHNNREAMNTMLAKLHSFPSFDAVESYLKENTHWNFKDETVDKFVQMLKDGFK